MSINSPFQNNTFYWVGGATGTTSASRFDWNEPSNWLTQKYVSAGISQVVTATEPPGVGDAVYVGIKPLATSIIRSPLLFGGFQGGITGGNWWGPGTIAGITNATGLSGTTYTGLALFNIGALRTYYGPRERSIGDTNPLTKYFHTDIMDYKFPIIGGGLTGEAISLLKAANVVGMTHSDWDALAAACTERQSKLVVKSNDTLIIGDMTSGTNGVDWNGYEQDPNWQAQNGYPSNIRRIRISFVDSLSPVTPAGTRIGTNVKIDNATGLDLLITNSKIQQIVILPLLRTFSGMSRWSDVFYAPSIELDNCVVGTISSTEIPFKLVTHTNCVIGNIYSRISTMLSPALNWINEATQQTYGYSNGGITWASVHPLHVLNGTFSTKRATTALIPGITFTPLELLNLDYKFGMWPNNYNTYTDGSWKYKRDWSEISVQLGSKWMLPRGATYGRYPQGSTYSVYQAQFSGSSDYYNNNPWDLRMNPHILNFANSGSIQDITCTQFKVITDIDLGDSNIIYVMDFKLAEYSYFDFASNPIFAGWRFGLISGTTYTGGLQFLDDTENTVVGTGSMRLLNYAVYGKTTNTRTNVVYDISNISPPVPEAG